MQNADSYNQKVYLGKFVNSMVIGLKTLKLIKIINGKVIHKKNNKDSATLYFSAFSELCSLRICFFSMLSNCNI